jgi:DNA-binding Lrp family transcriptional regulator
MPEHVLDETDRSIVNRLQEGFPICDRPYAAAAQALGIQESELITRLQRLLAANTLTRFGPMYNVERAGGAFVLAAMSVPQADLDRVVQVVNALPQVAHNYERAHRLNLWFVLATATQAEIDAAVLQIEELTGYAVYAMPKLREYFLELKLSI